MKEEKGDISYSWESVVVALGLFSLQILITMMQGQRPSSSDRCTLLGMREMQKGEICLKRVMAQRCATTGSETGVCVCDVSVAEGKLVCTCCDSQRVCDVGRTNSLCYVERACMSSCFRCLSRDAVS